MLTNHYFIHEKSISIPIKRNLSTEMKDATLEEYSLKQNFFDPSKSSPPNEFMIKLQMRMNKFHVDNKDDNFDIE
jgi:hypothetical protein